jgi:hypothetical protein
MGPLLMRGVGWGVDFLIELPKEKTPGLSYADQKGLRKWRITLLSLF